MEEDLLASLHETRSQLFPAGTTVRGRRVTAPPGSAVTRSLVHARYLCVTCLCVPCCVVWYVPGTLGVHCTVFPSSGTPATQLLAPHHCRLHRLPADTRLRHLRLWLCRHGTAHADAAHSVRCLSLVACGSCMRRLTVGAMLPCGGVVIRACLCMARARAACACRYVQCGWAGRGVLVAQAPHGAAQCQRSGWVVPGRCLRVPRRPGAAGTVLGTRCCGSALSASPRHACGSGVTV